MRRVSTTARARPFLSCLLLSILATGEASSQSPVLLPDPILPTAIDWPAPATAGPTPGAASVFLLGSANVPGIFVQRVKLETGGRVLPHVHDAERYSVVLEGTIYVGFTGQFDPENVVEIPAGGMYVAPAGVPHFIWAGNGPAIYQESGIAPSGTRFLPQE